MLEKKLSAEIRKTRVQQAILGSFAAGAIIATGGLAAAMVGAFGKTFHLPRPDNVKSAANRLVRKGYLRFEKRGARNFLALTEKGARYVRHMQAVDFTTKKPRHWDKKFRVVIFDIPEKRKRLRDVLRQTLVRIGFVRLQDSVWVYPYDCEELITLLKGDFKTGKGILYMIVDKIENDKIIRSQFGLS